jgi:hypothetical protein
MVTEDGRRLLDGFTVFTPPTVKEPWAGQKFVTVTTSLPGSPTRSRPHMPFWKFCAMKVRKR